MTISPRGRWSIRVFSTTDALSDARDRGEAVQVRRGDRRDRAHSHAHLDTGQDRQMTDNESTRHREPCDRSVVSFHRMEDGTREDYELLERARARLRARAAGSHSGRAAEAGSIAAADIR